MTHHLYTARLSLRELAPSDCSREYVEWLADPSIHRFLETRFSPQDEESITGFIAAVSARDDEYLFGIFIVDTMHHVGNIKVGPIHPRHRVADVSLFIGARGWWGKGVAREAISGLSCYAFEHLGVRKLSASMYAPNQGSKQAFLSAGYRLEGMRRDHYDLDGARCDLIELGLLPSDL